MYKIFHGFHLVEAYQDLKKAKRLAKNRTVTRCIKLTVTITLSLILWFLPIDTFGIEGLTVIEQRLISIFIFATLMWVFEAIPAWTTSVLIVVLLLLTVSDSSLWFLTQNISADELGQTVKYKSIMHCFADPIIMLFIGGFIPGIIMGVGLMIYSYIVGKKRHYVGREKKASREEILRTGKDALLALIMPIIIIGGILSGIFTATESGAIACAYAIVIGGLVYRELKLKNMFALLVDCAKSTGQVLVVVACASLFTWVITVAQVPQTVSALLSDSIHSRVLLLLIINIILLIAGTFIDTMSFGL